MTVLILERVAPGLKGELSRWMLEPKAGTFIGKVPPTVRDKLWLMACSRTGDGAALMIEAADNEQGYYFRLWGVPSRRPEDFDGLFLVRET